MAGWLGGCTAHERVCRRTGLLTSSEGASLWRCMPWKCMLVLARSPYTCVAGQRAEALLRVCLMKCTGLPVECTAARWKRAWRLGINSSACGMKSWPAVVMCASMRATRKHGPEHGPHTPCCMHACQVTASMLCMNMEACWPTHLGWSFIDECEPILCASFELNSGPRYNSVVGQCLHCPDHSAGPCLDSDID
jgi:hypothetical protein